MKRLTIFCILAALAGLFGLLPFTPSDAAELVVVQTLVVAEDAAGRVTLFAADGLTGEGADFEAAAEDLAARAPGELFLGAVEHLILTGTSADCLADAAHGDTLRPAVRVYTSELPAQRLAEDSETLTSFLNAHPGGVRLSDVRAALYEGAGVNIPHLNGEEGSYETL